MLTSIHPLLLHTTDLKFFWNVAEEKHEQKGMLSSWKFTPNSLNKTTAFHLAKQKQDLGTGTNKKARLNPDYFNALGSLRTWEWLPVVSPTESKCLICQAAHSSTRLWTPTSSLTEIPCWIKETSFSKLFSTRVLSPFQWTYSNGLSLKNPCYAKFYRKEKNTHRNCTQNC